MPEIVLLFAAITGGVLLLYFGAERVVDEAVAIAVRHGIPQGIIGATLVALGTSLPEWMVSVMAALDHHPDIALGNVAGSNLVNFGLLLPLVFWFRPRVLHRNCIRWDIPFAFLSMLLLALAATFFGGITWAAAAILLLLLVPYLYGQIHKAREDEARGDPNQVWHPWKLIAGLLAVVAGSRLLEYGAVGLATRAGVPEWIIAVTLVAIGTSFPELATTLSALRHKHAELGAGNIIGSNIWNTLFIAGSAGIISPLPSNVSSRLDLWAGVFMGLLLMIFYFRPDKKAGKLAAMALAAVYLGEVTRWILTSL